MTAPMSTQSYPDRGTCWLVDAMLRDVRRRILVEVVGGGHGNVVFSRAGVCQSVCVLTWHRRMNPVLRSAKIL